MCRNPQTIWTPHTSFSFTAGQAEYLTRDKDTTSYFGLCVMCPVMGFAKVALHLQLCIHV